jgi:hypothetical protein
MDRQTNPKPWRQPPEILNRFGQELNQSIAGRQETHLTLFPAGIRPYSYQLVNLDFACEFSPTYKSGRTDGFT